MARNPSAEPRLAPAAGMIPVLDGEGRRQLGELREHFVLLPLKAGFGHGIGGFDPLVLDPRRRRLRAHH
jgi:hypothetical protein